MEENDLFITSDTLFVNYYDFKIIMIRKWFATCGVNDFRKCMKTLKWACSDDPNRFAQVLDCIDRSIKYSDPEVTIKAFDKKMKVLSKYRKEYLNYEF